MSYFLGKLFSMYSNEKNDEWENGSFTRKLTFPFLSFHFDFCMIRNFLSERNVLYYRTPLRYERKSLSLYSFGVNVSM